MFIHILQKHKKTNVSKLKRLLSVEKTRNMKKRAKVKMFKAKV